MNVPAPRATRWITGAVFVVVGLVAVGFLTDGGRLVSERSMGSDYSEAQSSTAAGSTQSQLPLTPPENGAQERPESATAAPAAASSAPENIGDVETPEIVRIPIPPQLAAWFESDPSRLAAHDRLEREPRNPQRAPFLEAGFREFIASNPSLANTEALSIVCRSNACEILAIGYGDDAFRTWLEEMGRAVDAGWLEEMPDAGPEQVRAGLGCGGEGLAPNVTALSCFFRIGEPEGPDADTMGLTAADLLIAESPEAQTNDANRIPVRQDMVTVLQGSGELAELHLRMEREPIDYSWSEFIEGQIADYFASRSAFETSSIVLVECRTSFCEIQTILPDDTAILDWITGFEDFDGQSWHDLEEASANGAELSSGQFGLILILERRSSEG